MKLNKFLLLTVFIAVCFPAFAQKNESVFLKWKLQPGQMLSYKTVMEVDTASRVDWSAGGMFKSMGIDSSHAGKMQEMFKELSSAAQTANLVTTLSEKHKGLIDVSMVSKPKVEQKKVDKPSGPLANNIHEMFNKLTSGVMLRGVLNGDGTIASFYLANGQKNLLAIFFELPAKAVKEGDTWPLDIHLISMGQTFNCDSAFKKNEVKVLKIENKNNEHLVTLKYDIEEYVSGDLANPFADNNAKTMMDVKYQGLVVFSVEKGKWISYGGIMSTESTGFMGAKSKSRYALIEE